ncbi:flagellar filament capping protein FliD [candidate division KSB1 bacterium]
MAEISSLGSTTSLDKYLSAYAARENKPVEKLKEKKTSLSKKQDVLTDLKTTLKKLRTQAKNFSLVGTEAKLSAKTAVSSNESYFTVEADATAVTGVNTLSISRLAQNDIAVSDKLTSSSTTIANEFFGTTQEISIQVGSDSSVTVSIEFENESESNSSVLSRIATEINDTVEDISANVISSSSTKSKLTFVSDEEGSEYTITLQDSGDSELLEFLGFIDDDEGTRIAATTTKGGYLTEVSEELDSLFEINGIEITSSTNKITEVIQGVTIQLRKAQESNDEPETFTISSDAETVIKQIEEFIDVYNETINYISAKSKVDVSKNERGELSGNFTYSNLRIGLRTIISSKVSGVESGNPSVLTELGVKINTGGILEIDDEDTLEDVILEKPDAVLDLFSGDNGIAVQLDDFLENYTRTGRIIDTDISSVKRQTTTVDRQISQYESRYQIREESLKRQYTQIEKAYTLLQSQQAALQNSGFYSNFSLLYDNTNLLDQRRIYI